MFGRNAAIALAATCASLIVIFTPGLASQLNARPAPPQQVGGTGRPCLQAWPYYETPCLADARQPAGQARKVRMIALETTSAGSRPVRR